jgi:hypothetical protein
MHFKKSSKFAAVTIPGVGMVQGETVLSGAEYSKYVALGLLESCDAPALVAAPPAAPAAPPAGETAPVGGSDGPVDSTSKSEETGDDLDPKPTAKKSAAKR